MARLTIATLGAAVGVWFLTGSIVDWRDAQTSKGWPRAPGVIESVQLAETGSGRAFCATPHISYRYQIAGVDYVGGLVRHATTCLKGTEATSLLNRYSVGQRVEVSYSPTSPEQALLEPGVMGTSTWIGAIAGAISLVAFLFTLHWEFKWRSRD